MLNNNYLADRCCSRSPVSRFRTAATVTACRKCATAGSRCSTKRAVGTEDVRRRIVDFGLQGYFTSHHPVLVPEPLTLEPSETWSKSDLDEYGTVLAHIDAEARDRSRVVMSSPHASSVHRVHEEAVDDPEQWAMTWRGWKRKYGDAAEWMHPPIP